MLNIEMLNGELSGRHYADSFNIHLQHCSWSSSRTGYHDGIFHPVDYFFIRRADGSQDTSQLGLFATHEIIGGEPGATGHPVHLTADRIEVVEVIQAALVELLQDGGCMGKGSQCFVDGTGPFWLRHIVSNRHATAAPGKFGEP